MKADEIKSTVDEIRKLRKEKPKMSEDAFKTKYETLFKENPALFKMAVSDEFDTRIFNKLIELRKKIEDNSCTQYDMDVEFGKFMAGKFIDPVIKPIK